MFAYIGCGAAPVSAQSSDAESTIASMSFLIGDWQSADGIVADTGQASHGTSHMTSEAGGTAILRRDHHVRAEYTDGAHVIHYTNATIVPNRSVTFDTSSHPGMPNFRLTYQRSAENFLAVHFEIEPPGQSAFHPIATDPLKRTL